MGKGLVCCGVALGAAQVVLVALGRVPIGFPSDPGLASNLGVRINDDVLEVVVICPWPCETPRWWPGKVLAVVSR
jgi:hypothetical protein